jgi:menaquinone-dependent protoporphyrinogen oxidase
MRVLITAASRHGATSGIAEAIAETLREAGLTVDLARPEEASGIERYDAVVLGSAVYAGRWIDSARTFADRYAESLATRPVWLFSSGPIGDPPKPDADPPEVAPLVERIAAREHRSFPGRLDRASLGFLERTIVGALRAPDGDFRDFAAVRGWAAEIARALVGEPVAR